MISNERRDNKRYLAAEQGADARYSAAKITMDKLLHICAYIPMKILLSFFKHHANEFNVDGRFVL